MSHDGVENAPILGAFSSVVSYWASYSLTGNTAGTAPSFFAANGTGAKEERWQAGQKSWLRKDCAETATGAW